MRLFVAQAQRRRNRQRAARIVDVNAGFGGGENVTEFVKTLLQNGD